METPRVERQILLLTTGVPERSKLRRRRKVQIRWQRSPYTRKAGWYSRGRNVSERAHQKRGRMETETARSCAFRTASTSQRHGRKTVVLSSDTRSIFLFNFAQVGKHYGERRRHWDVDTHAGWGKTGWPQH